MVPGQIQVLPEFLNSDLALQLPPVLHSLLPGDVTLPLTFNISFKLKIILFITRIVCFTAIQNHHAKLQITAGHRTFVR